MAILTLARVALVAGLLAGCTAKAVNRAPVYKEVQGVVQMEVKLPPGEAVTKVQFQVNGKVVAEDDDPSDGYKTEIDTQGLEPDVLAKIAAVGVRANGSNVVLRENFILVVAPPAEEDDDPEPAATEKPAGGEQKPAGGEDAVGGTTSGG